ncbi:transporter [Deinococcus aerius]|uniref:Transporter n=3 Tax=Deinococcus TaxID=1298 RepID=A0A2I9CSI3_9DEIO|nr:MULTISPECIES: transporter [Deinococcus]QBY07490.1 transporter [Deinococcus metallilatus]RXJ14911.1 transporter [Deinococcus metallilatus]TLK31032.1 transporter [Deinococcus metallilatus]GBF04632.1 transporter [Deinococcus aerius]GMA17839.1 membrane protein [Deinococcus metallilatus]
MGALSLLLFVLVPAGTTVLGGVLATLRPPGERWRSAFQHFAAGAVFAAVAGELLPEIKQEHQPLGVLLGFALGVVLMLGLERLFKPVAGAGPTPEEGGAGNATGLALITGIDILIDGLLIGVSAGTNAQAGFLITLALTLELLFLSLSTVAALGRAGVTRARVIGVTLLFALALAVGVLIGALLFAGLSGFALAVVLSFAAAALLYLVTEELLTEAHQVTETPLLTATFFAGFLAIFLVELLLPGAGA